jgi:hypothetical protein
MNGNVLLQKKWIIFFQNSKTLKWKMNNKNSKSENKMIILDIEKEIENNCDIFNLIIF